MTDREHAMYRYLTMWCDFKPAEARKAIEESRERGEERRRAA